MAFLPPGIPTLLEGFVSLGATSLLTGDSPNLLNVLGNIVGIGTQWGIFDTNGNQVVQPDSIVGFDYRKEYTISDYPVEQGAFESYDKVETPYEITIRMTKGGSLSDRQTFLSSIDTIKGDTNLYSIATPEVTLVNGNIVSVDYSRKNDRGVGLITVDCRVMEVRETAQQQFTNTPSSFSSSNVAAPQSSDPENGGVVQPQTPTSQVQTQVYNSVF